MSEDDLLRDQRGSPAYISPDVLSGRPYLGKFLPVMLIVFDYISFDMKTI